MIFILFLVVCGVKLQHKPVNYFLGEGHGLQLGGVYIGQMIIKDAMHKALYGKTKKKKPSMFARVMKKLAN